MAEPGQSRRTEDRGADRELAHLREQIDKVDVEILECLNRRARVVQDVGRLKRESGGAVYSAGREAEIVRRLRDGNEGPFPDAAIAAVFREIVSGTRALEKVVHVAYLGPAGTFSHRAAIEIFGRQAVLEPQVSIADVFTAVERGRVQLGVAPIENTTEGIVTATYDLLPGFAGTLCGEFMLSVSYDLLSTSGRLADVHRVASHPQPLGQCRGWLDRNLPGVERVETPSTAAAAQLATEDDGVAAIAGGIAGQDCGLRAVELAIEDRQDNTTRFVLIGTKPPERGDAERTSAVFTLRKDESGALHRLLEPFASRGVNLTSLHLRPIKDKPWEYLFFMELEGHATDPRVAEALEVAGGVAHSHRVLGSFPHADRRE
ncbi:MAG: prephenate dehydratase [Myxococcota bacterium]|jgi:chorismate mutase/prephenate dehydratase|nr:prephenate dehydratase [bacterium]MDP6074876.1 prephenate dehydratase [Myxococcota bacterium]MDP6243611.1 prephenate dehydratase [Myxococcota bacterium]MDP7075215.1 prephenate dehydratase [Myxococcota bacterium]MDP7300897.1 prephenate dehydratase [Myxococcota bacterium]